MPLSPGSRLGPYEVTAPLGEGGMGEVYLATDTRLRRPVALKILRGGPTEDARMRLLREARAAAALNHPNICAVFDVAEVEGLDFAVFEFVEGRTLSEAIPPDGLPLEQVLRYGEGIAGGLAHAHERGIVHRDLKSGNVMIDSDGRLRILDFGIARRLEADAHGDAATTLGDRSAVSGTLAYMSPEALRGEPLDARTDIWSLGIVLFEMVAGGRPFAGGQTFELTASILKDPAPRLPGKVPAGLRSAVSRCLAKDRTDRYQRASEVRAVLEALQAGARTQRSKRQEARPPLADRTPDSRGRAPTPIPPAADAAPGIGTGGGPSPEQASIVIVPFEDLSPDPEHAFFADGLTEEIITDLSKVRAMRVISRTSAALLRGCLKDAPAIARQMSVQYVLEGTVRRAGRQLRITTKLIDAATDSALWAEKYAGSLDDVFDIQEQVSQAIVGALKVTLTPEERRRIADRPVANPAAYDCYLRARHEMWRYDEASIGRAIEWTRQALEIVGENDLLYAMLGMAYIGYVRAGIRPAASLEQAEACAARLDAPGSRSPAACLLRAKINGHSRSLQAAVRDLKVVLEQDPNHAEALLELAYADERARDCYRRAWHEMAGGTGVAFERALRLVTRGIETIGEHPTLLAAMAQMHYLAIDWGLEPRSELLAAAVDCTRRVEALDPDRAPSLLGRLERHTGSQERAIRHLEEAVTRDPADTVSLWFLSHTYSLHAGKPAAGRAAARRLQAIDPLTALNMLDEWAACWAEADFTGALAAVDEWERRDPEDIWVRMFRVQTLARLGRFEEALREADADAARLSPPLSTWSAGLAHALRGEREELLALAAGRAHEFLWTDPDSPCFAASWFAQAGDCEHALDWLERLVDRGSFNYPMLAHGDPLLENLRGDPRFDRLLDRIRPVWENFAPRLVAPGET